VTHGNHLKRILENITRAQAEGFQIKINTVAMRGVNDHELFDFLDWSEKTGIEVRFLELMRIGFALENQKSQFISAGEMMERIKSRHELLPVQTAVDSTSFNFVTRSGARIGFIASESKAFCGGCSRWRLSADGTLRACLLKDDGMSLLNTDAAARDTLFNQVLNMKPAMRPLEVKHAMNQIGG
jgi:cyclic pyranopterin phosphate synthase